MSRCEGVGEVAAFGIPDQRRGERPMILVVKSDSSLDIETIQAAVKAEVKQGRLSKWALPERVEFVESLPKTSVGKMDKELLRATYG